MNMRLRIRTVHHLTPKCRYRPKYRPNLSSPENLLTLYKEKHVAWHRLFREATLEEAIKLLQRVARMKGRAK